MRFLYLILFCVTFIILLGFEQPEDKEEVTRIIEVDGDPHFVKRDIERMLPRLEVMAVYDTVFNGIAVKGKPAHLSKLSKIEAIVNQHPVQTYRTMDENLNESVPFLLQENREKRTVPFTGKGVKVGVIDTGLDYTHPDLAANYKGGFDVFDFDDDPMESTEESPTIHGTHVAGVIGANGKMKGIAPDAELYGYRALGPGGFGTSVHVIAAMEEAVKDNMDIINLSLGNDVNGPDWPTSVAVDKAVELGTTVVVAAGNTGPDDWTVGSPATATKAITVGASTPPLKIPVLIDRFAKKEIPLIPMMGSTDWKLDKRYQLVYGGLGDKPIENAQGKIVVMKRGKVPFTEKAELAEKNGAIALIVYNNEAGEFQGTIDDGSINIPVVAVSEEDGEWLKQQSDSPKAGWVDTEYVDIVDSLAPFSSRGPVTANWAIKPDILAPGVAINSTIPGGYQELQGTSMAAPHIAGVAALIKEAHPEWQPEDIKTALLSTATPLKNKKGHLLAPTEQGMGKVNVPSAVEPKLQIEPAQLNFGRFNSSFPKKKIKVQIKNTSKSSQKVHFSLPKKKHGLIWDLPKAFTLAPEQSKSIEIGLNVTPAFLDKGLHQGWIRMAVPDQTFDLPYLFMMETSDYPRAMGFEIAVSDFDSSTYDYQFYLPEDADNVKVDLYNPDTLMHERTLFELSDQQQGVVEGELSSQEIGKDGRYIAVITVENENKHYSYGVPVEINNFH
ncbi:S8 family serine peptidase [Thalassobacillus sp. B23F22_16]|uniref:S8 family serine peptidase n=1 Tax=Thalassobacillus sp. B23F22_16 TaxID=3459513 RepID=UPI00373E4E9E